MIEAILKYPFKFCDTAATNPTPLGEALKGLDFQVQKNVKRVRDLESSHRRAYVHTFYFWRG